MQYLNLPEQDPQGEDEDTDYDRPTFFTKITVPFLSLVKPIRFNKLHYNDGQKYHPQSGIICEVTGAYYFTYRVCCKGGKVQVSVLDTSEKYKEDLDQVTGRV